MGNQHRPARKAGIFNIVGDPQIKGPHTDIQLFTDRQILASGKSLKKWCNIHIYGYQYGNNRE